jgi:hypothetical protein
MRKSFLVIIICIICVTAFQAFTTNSNSDFKNLQILPKDISNHDLDSVMHHFSASLGVRCNFCHVRNEAEKKMDFASDDKPEKKVARKMMLMAIDINKNYFKGMDMDMDHDMDSSMNKDMHHDMDTTMMNAEPSKYMLQTVTCFTCHRGDAHPESKTPAMPAGPKPPMPPPAQNK